MPGQNLWVCQLAYMHYTVAVTEGMAKKELNLLKTCLEGKRFELPIAMDVEDPPSERSARSRVDETCQNGAQGD